MSEKNNKPKVLMYYSYGNRVGGPLTYINTIINSDLKLKYEFDTCYQNMTPGGFNIKFLLCMMRKIKEANPDIVHVHGLQSEGFYGVLAAKLAGCRRIVTTVHGFAFDSKSSSKIKRILYRYFVEPITLRLSDKVYCVCEFASNRNIIKNNTKKNNFGYIHNCIPMLKINQSRDILRRKLNISESDIVFIISGRVSREKGFDLLIEVIEKISPSLKEKFKLIVAGEGPFSETFSKSMNSEIQSGKVIMIGQTNEIGNYLNASDVCLLPSYHENLPIALLEAGSFGLPCIASDVGGVPEIIIDGKTGFLIKNSVADAYIEKIELFIRKPEILTEMKKNIKTDINNRFCISDMCKKIEEVYK